MTNIILNIVGIGCILYALIVIKNSMEDSEEDINKKINDYNSFREVLDNKQEEIGSEKLEDKSSLKSTYKRPKNQGKEKIFKPIVKDLKEEKSQHNKSNNEIIKLNLDGLSKEEIAKRTNKSIREVEVIIKLHENR